MAQKVEVNMNPVFLGGVFLGFVLGVLVGMMIENVAEAGRRERRK